MSTHFWEICKQKSVYFFLAHPVYSFSQMIVDIIITLIYEEYSYPVTLLVEAWAVELSHTSFFNYNISPPFFMITIIEFISHLFMDYMTLYNVYINILYSSS